MPNIQKPVRFLLLAFAVVALGICEADAAKPSRPSRPWKGSILGQGNLIEFLFDDGTVIGRRDSDTAVGKSTHLGRFTLLPEFSWHTLDFATLEVTGVGVWRAANGDLLFVTYTGQGFPNTDPNTADEFPFAAIAIFEAVGGTGRFSGRRW